MENWTNLFLVLHIVLALGIIALVLLQHGKGADMGSGFGGGSSSSLFGASGSANFLSRMTAVLATLFFLSSLSLAYLATNKSKATGVMEAVKEQPAGESPRTPADVPTPAQPDPSGAAKSKEIPK